MIIQTHCQDRREMVRKLSEYLQIPAVYMRVPTCAYRIGTITVNRDGSITGDAEQLASLMPFLLKSGYATENERQTAFTASLEGWTVPQAINLLRLLCAKQHLIRRMLNIVDYRIETALVRVLSADPPKDLDDLEARISATEVGGFTISSHVLSVTLKNGTPKEAAEMLFTKLLSLARGASRVRLTECDPESEKYAAHAFLMRLGLNGTEHRELRHTLMDHLNGYAAFKSAADMQAHKAKQAQLRRSRKAVAQT